MAPANLDYCGTRKFEVVAENDDTAAPANLNIAVENGEITADPVSAADSTDAQGEFKLRFKISTNDDYTATATIDAVYVDFTLTVIAACDCT